MDEPINKVQEMPVGQMDEIKMPVVVGEGEPDYIKLVKEATWEQIVRFMNRARVNINYLLREYHEVPRREWENECAKLRLENQMLRKDLNKLAKQYKQLKKGKKG